MNIETIRDFFAWCAVINYIILILWFVLFLLARDPVYKLHSKWFKLSEEQFDRLNYIGMMFFKLGIILLNLVPYLALRIV